MRLFRFDDPAHAGRRQRLLPWYANGYAQRPGAQQRRAPCRRMRGLPAGPAGLSRICRRRCRSADDLEVPGVARPDACAARHPQPPASAGVGGLMDKWDRLPIWARVALRWVQSGLMVLLLAAVVIGRPASVQYYRALGAGPALASGADRVVVGRSHPVQASRR